MNVINSQINQLSFEDTKDAFEEENQKFIILVQHIYQKVVNKSELQTDSVSKAENIN